MTGAGQIYEVKSCGSLEWCGATFPEILKPSAEFGAAQGDDCVGAGDTPVHAGPLESGSDRYFASGLENAGGGTQTLCLELWVAHATPVANNVGGTFCRFNGGADIGPEGADDGAQLSVVQFGAARRCPLMAISISRTAPVGWRCIA